MIKPKIGAPILYWALGDWGEPSAARVTCVLEGGLIDLAFVDVDGDVQLRRNVPLLQDEEAPVPGGRYATWPHRKNLAAATETSQHAVRGTTVVQSIKINVDSSEVAAALRAIRDDAIAEINAAMLRAARPTGTAAGQAAQAEEKRSAGDAAGIADVPKGYVSARGGFLGVPPADLANKPSAQAKEDKLTPREAQIVTNALSRLACDGAVAEPRLVREALTRELLALRAATEERVKPASALDVESIILAAKNAAVAEIRSSIQRGGELRFRL